MSDANRAEEIRRRISELENKLWFDCLSYFDRDDIEMEIYGLNEELEDSLGDKLQEIEAIKQ